VVPILKLQIFVFEQRYFELNANNMFSKGLRHLPNMITLLNLFSGCVALVCILEGQWLAGAWLVGLALVADFLDGAVARLLRVQSDVGKQLDSLADMVSFGVVPGTAFYELLRVQAAPEGGWRLALLGFAVSVFAGLRLAKFNTDTRQTIDFIGLPTPAATIFTVGLLLVAHQNTHGLRPLVTHPVVLYSCIAGLCMLMVSELRLFSFKFKRFTWSGNEIKFIFAGVSLILLTLLREAALPIIILFYLLLAAILHFLNKTP
jgi:CDP-diacylglycerol--serine O-phosphatidyltransferase